jgi:hypothetical protein
MSFPNRIDVWGRLCTHFEAAKVMTFACFSVLSHVHFLMYEFFFFQRTARRKQEDLEREERIRISHSTPIVLQELMRMQGSMYNSIARINAYARQYVSRSVRGGESEGRVGNGGVGGPY